MTASTGVAEQAAVAPSAQYWGGRRVLVAGGTGFLGSRLAERLEGLGADVVACSRRTGVDLRVRSDADRVMQEARPDFVFQLAADQGGNQFQLECPGTILHDNALIVLNAMDAARTAGVQRYVSAIAACAYPGDASWVCFREEDLEAAPMHGSADNYGITRRLAVAQGRHYRAQYEFEHLSVVLANTYGPGDHFEPQRSHAVAALIRRFIEAQRDGRPSVEVWGSGRAERDWLYRDDAVEGLLLAAERAPDAGLLNIGSGRAVPTSELAETIKRATGYEGELYFDTTKPEGAPRKLLDVTRMRAELGWTPPTALDEGIRRTVEWYRASGGAEA